MDASEQSLENPTVKSEEETNLVARSNKKVKIRDGNLEMNELATLPTGGEEEAGQGEPKRKISYREKLLGHASDDITMEYQMRDYVEVFDDKFEVVEEDEEDYLTIRISREEKKRIRIP